MKEIFDVKNMTCAACKDHVEKACMNVNGVKTVNVNLLMNNATIEYDEKICNKEDIFKSVFDAGYQLIDKKDNMVKLIKEEKDNSGKKLIASIVILLFHMYLSMGNGMWGLPVPFFVDIKANPVGYAFMQVLLVVPILMINRKYLINGFKMLFKRSPNMDSLIAIGSSVSFVYGLVAIFFISYGVQTNNNSIVQMYVTNLYFESSSMILVFVSIGKFLEGKSKKQTTKALEKLLDLAPKMATKIIEGKEVIVSADSLNINDIIVIKKGEKVSADGIIIEGNGSFDESSFTGEAVPNYKSVDDEVFASSICMSGYVKVKVTKEAENTKIKTIIKLVEEASNSKAPISKLADSISKVFVPVILIIATLTFILNITYCLINEPSYVTNYFEIAFNFTVTVIVIACPCALGLATPVAIMVGTGKGAENGLLFKNAEVLEKAHSIEVVVFDKTGTITEGKPKVVKTIKYLDDVNEDILYSMELMSEHPLANAITSYFENKAKEVKIDNYQAIEGEGLVCTLNNDVYKIGNNRLVKDNKIKEIIASFAKKGYITLVYTKNDTLLEAILIKDEIKENSQLAIESLKKQKITTVMLTGDSLLCAKEIASEVGIDKVYAEVYPEEKAKIVEKIKNETNKAVAMVGDGVNDAIALATSDVGISIGSGSDVALETSDIVLLHNDLLDVLNVIKLSKRVIKTIKLGLFWAFFYNCICVLLATGILFYITKGNFIIKPMIGAIAMSISSVSVVLNALTINLFKIEKKEKKMETKTFKVEKMMCMNCAKHVENACLSVEGITEAKVNLKKKNVTVKSDNEINDELIKKAITEAGYSVK